MDRKTIILEILKRLRDKKEVKQQDLGLDLESFGEVSEMILNEGLANGIKVQRGGQGSRVLYAWYSSAKITLLGLQYIEANDTEESSTDESNEEPKLQIYAVPWPKGKTDAEVEENPPSVPQAEKFLKDPNIEIIDWHNAKVLHFTQYWYAVTIQYKEKVSQEA
ncbi:YjcQ family protein [Priestia megaterium]|uniref:YjcQ family protein n=1 Tax=Priestia megaterium TaxID=1404 RepID=UPI0031014FD9